MFGVGTFLYAVDVFGYGFMSLAAAFAAPAFGGSRLENWIRWLLLANWLVVFVGPPVMMFWPQLAFLWLVWILTIPVPPWGGKRRHPFTRLPSIAHRLHERGRRNAEQRSTS